jgi:hypothetical protein
MRDRSCRAAVEGRRGGGGQYFSIICNKIVDKMATLSRIRRILDATELSVVVLARANISYRFIIAECCTSLRSNDM